MAVACTAAAFVTFHEPVHKSRWFIPAYLTAGLACNIIWCVVTRYYLEGKDRIYSFSLMWDTVIVLVWYLIPLFAFGVKIDKWGVLGLALMILGLAIFKLRNH